MDRWKTSNTTRYYAEIEERKEMVAILDVPGRRRGCTGEESSSPTFVGGISLENNQQYIYCESERTLGEIPDGEYTLRF